MQSLHKFSYGQHYIAAGEKEIWKNVIMIICKKYTHIGKMPG
ncbi:hypothetical protein ASZ90_017241 [hydrocarbon metagenome]|uniref:Uncharacterized protein n=1 Tax=hydrocarbon metagenome TaxID=938273 RepID=A0A0W8E9M1_9ZZZZ